MSDNTSIKSIEELKALIGDRMPKIRAVPAAWWITTDPGQLSGYDQWVSDYDAHRDKIDALARSIGMTADDAYYVSYGTSSHLTGFRVPTFMGYWNTENPEYRPIPDGWRIDKKADRLVPSRRTKADRESDANKQWAAIKSIPALPSYLKGMPSEIFLDDRDFGGTCYRVQYRRGDGCVMAFSGGDPDRQPETRMNDQVDSAIWERQKLSALLAITEEL